MADVVKLIRLDIKTDTIKMMGNMAYIFKFESNDQ